MQIRMKIRKCLLIGVFIAIILLPTILLTMSTFSDSVFDITLYNDNVSQTKPEFSGTQFINGDFQEEFEDYYNTNFQPRGFMTKIYNQLKYSLFNESNTIIVGKNDVLFEDKYINEFYGYGEYQNDIDVFGSDLNSYMQNLESLSDKLKNFDKRLIVYSTPSKCDYNEAEIPSKYKLNADTDSVRRIEYFNEHINEYDVVYINCADLLTNEEYPVFPKSGTHWSRTAEQIVSKRILDEIVTYYPDAKTLEFTGVTESNEEIYREQDIFKMLNIFSDTNETYYEYTTKVNCGEDYYNPGILVQGCSFSEGLVYDIVQNNITPNIDLLFYNMFWQHSELAYNRTTIDPGNNINNSFSVWDSDSFSLARILDRTDVVCIEINPSLMYIENNGFVYYLNDFLDSYSPSAKSSSIQNLTVDKNAEHIQRNDTSGLYYYEDEGVWGKKYCNINITNPQVSKNGLLCEFFASEYLDYTKETDIDVYINGKKATTISPKQSGKVSVFIPPTKFEISDDHFYCVEFYCSQDFSLSDLGISDDGRDLAIYFYYLGEMSADNIITNYSVESESKIDPASVFTGYHSFEADGSWVKAESKMFLCNENIKQNGLEVDFRIPGEFEWDKPVSVSVTVNGIACHSEVYNQPGDVSLIIPASSFVANRSDFYEIELHCSQEFIPSKVLNTDDNRNLSLYIKYIGEVRNGI